MHSTYLAQYFLCHVLVLVRVGPSGSNIKTCQWWPSMADSNVSEEHNALIFRAVHLKRWYLPTSSDGATTQISIYI